MSKPLSEDPKRPPEVAGTNDIPKATLDWLGGLVRRETSCTLWTITANLNVSIVSALDRNGGLEVLVDAGYDYDSRKPLQYPATLSRKPSSDKGFEFTLEFRGPLPGPRMPYAITVGTLNLWLFQPLTLGKYVEPTVEPARRAGGDGADSSGAVSRPLVAGPLAAKGRDASMGGGLLGGGLGAEGDEEMVLTDRNDDLHLYWRDGLLEIRLKRPPRLAGQPVVVETTVRDVWGEPHTVRDVVTVDQRITEGKFAGYVYATIPRFEPCQTNLEDLRIIVRPLQPDDLPLLDPPQVVALLAGQSLKALTNLNEAGPPLEAGPTLEERPSKAIPAQEPLASQGEKVVLRAAAAWDDQLHAVNSPAATWLVRVSSGKAVR